MSEPTSLNVKVDQCTMEERLSTVGARIDNLMSKASETKTNVTTKLKDAKDVSSEVLDELKVAMDEAWQDLNQAWSEVKAGTERAANKLHGQHKPCCSEHHSEEKEDKAKQEA